MKTGNGRSIAVTGLMALLMILQPAITTDASAGPRGASYALSIAPGNVTRTVDFSCGTAFATYGFQVRNDGDTSLPALDLELYPAPPQNWSYNFVPSCPLEITPLDTKTILLMIYPAADAEAKRYTFQIKGKTGVGTNSISINLDSVQFAGVEVRAPAAQSGSPGETLEFTFEMVNTGNGKDKFFCEPVMAQLPSILPYLKDGNNWTAEISPHSSAFKMVVMTIPSGALANVDGLQLSLRARSSFNVSVDFVGWTLVYISRVYNLCAGVDVPERSVLPGANVEFNVTVLNLGNGPDTANVRVERLSESQGWIVSVEKYHFNISPGVSASTRVSVTPIANALNGSFFFEVVAVSGVIGNSTESRARFTVVVMARYGLQLPSTQFVSSPAAPGTVVRFDFNITNQGNVFETVALSVADRPLNWHPALSHLPKIVLGVGATQQVTLTVEVPPDFALSPAGNYTISVRVSGAESGYTGLLLFFIPVKAVASLTMDIESPDATVNLFSFARHEFLVRCSNTGNAPDDLTFLLLGDEAPWARVDYQVLPLGSNEVRSVRLSVEVPAASSPGKSHIIRVIAVSGNDPSVSIERSVNITVINADPAGPPRLSVEPARQKVVVTGGRTTTIEFTIGCLGSNATNVTLAVNVTGSPALTLDFLTSPGDLRPGKSATWKIRITAPPVEGPARRYTLDVRAAGSGIYSEAATVELTVKPVSTSQPAVSIVGLGAAIALFAVLGGLALGSTEIVFFSLLSLFIPLYSKLHREEVLDRYLRGKIHGYIIANPGEHYNSIKVQLKLKNGTLAYHLRVLEREGFIKSNRDGMYKRFYPKDAAMPRKKSELSSMQEVVLEHIRSDPGITQNALAVRMGVSNQVVNYHVKNLASAGVLRLERDGRETHCFIQTGPET